MYLGFGPVALRVSAGLSTLPRIVAERASSTAGQARVLGAIDLIRDPGAGVDGPVTDDGQVVRGPGFALQMTDPELLVARVADEISASAALVAALSMRTRGTLIGVLHAGALRFGGQAVLVLGRSGAGKSTLVGAHPARAIAANAVLVWPEGPRFFLTGLPVTGKGDTGIREGAWPILGGIMLSATRRRPKPATALAWVLSSIATATGVAPELSLATALSTECTWRGRTESE